MGGVVRPGWHPRRPSDLDDGGIDPQQVQGWRSSVEADVRCSIHGRYRGLRCPRCYAQMLQRGSEGRGRYWMTTFEQEPSESGSNDLGSDFHSEEDSEYNHRMGYMGALSQDSLWRDL